MSETALLQFGCPELEPLRRAILKVTPSEKGVPPTTQGSKVAPRLVQYLPKDPIRYGAALGLAEGYANAFFDKPSIGEVYGPPSSAHAKDVTLADMVTVLVKAIDSLASCNSANLLEVLRAMRLELPHGSEKQAAWEAWVWAGQRIGYYDSEVMREGGRQVFEQKKMNVDESFPWPMFNIAGEDISKYVSLDNGKTKITIYKGVITWSYGEQDYVVKIRYVPSVRWEVGTVTPAPSPALAQMIHNHMFWLGFTGSDR